MIQSWSEIVAYYHDLRVGHGHEFIAEFEDFARFIDESSIGLKLFGWTSMSDLCIQQAAHSPYSAPYLRISLQVSGLVEFRYLDTDIETRQWHMIVPKEHIVATLIRFLDHLHWIAGPLPQVPEPVHC